MANDTKMDAVSLDAANQRLLAYNQRTWQIPFVYVSLVGGYFVIFSQKTSDIASLLNNELFCKGLLAILILGFITLLFLYSLWVSQSKAVKRINELDPKSDLTANRWRGFLPYALAVGLINSMIASIASKAFIGLPSLYHIVFVFICSSLWLSILIQAVLVFAYFGIGKVIDKVLEYFKNCKNSK